MIRTRSALSSIGMTGVLLGGAAGAGAATNVSPAQTEATIFVHPGQSIQAAVDRASPGDTVLIEPGVYRQSVLIAKDDLRLRGSGASLGGTVIEPASTPRGFCGKQLLSGICVVDPQQRRVVGVEVSDLLVRDFANDGVIGIDTRNLLVHNVTAHHNARYGVTRFDSTGGGYFNNIATGSGDAGIYIGDSPKANLTILGNEVWNNGFGILTRNAQGVDVALNDVHDNCIGIFFWWVPGVAGNGQVSYNTVRRNNRFCSASEQIPFNYSGSGIALMGAHDLVVKQNAVFNNGGDTIVSGGIVLVSGESQGGPPSTGNVIKHNTAFGDAPADIVDHSRGKNTFIGNKCFVSEPSGLCRY